MSASEATRLPATFNRLAWSNLAAQSAEQIALAASPIVAVLLLGVGEGETGLLQTALTLPFVLMAIPAGLLTDRISRRHLMAGAEALRAAALLAILLLIGLHQLTLPLLALAGFIAVCGTVVYSVAAPALVPSLVSPQQLPAANTRIELARTIAFASGPALGGFLVGFDAAVISGASGIEPATAAERGALKEFGLPVRNTGTYIGHGVETQFLANLGIACAAIEHGKLFAPAGSGDTGDSPSGLSQVIVTSVGNWRGEGLALVERIG